MDALWRSVCVTFLAACLAAPSAPAEAADAKALDSGHWRPAYKGAAPDEKTDRGGPRLDEAEADNDAGRVNALAFDADEPHTIYAGTPAAGLWRTRDDGKTWEPLTDKVDLGEHDEDKRDVDKRDGDKREADADDGGDVDKGLAIADVALDPQNDKTIYILTGDGDVSYQIDFATHATPSAGVLKSVDGGATWARTGLAWDADANEYGHRLVIHPRKPNILFVASSAGLLRSTDGGATWSVRLAADGGRHSEKDLPAKLRNPFWDVVINPIDPSLVFAATQTGVWRSTDEGETWSLLGGGLPSVTTRESSRIRLALSPAGPLTLYVLYGSPSGFTIGLYRSDDRGDTFERRSWSNPRPSGRAAPALDLSRVNILHAANDFESQASYDLAMTVSPTNVDKVHVGALDTWASDDGGRTWRPTSDWRRRPGDPQYVHADVHTMAYRGATLFTGSDGGVFLSENDGESWKGLNNALLTGGITQIYSICITPADPTLVYYGAQDNGTWRLRVDKSLERVAGGDGMVCQIDPRDPNVVYHSYYSGQIERSRDGGRTNRAITPRDPPSSARSPSVSGPWVTPYILGVRDPNDIYGCYGDVWRGQYQGFDWTNLSLGALGPSRQCVGIAMSPTEPDVIWVAKREEVYYWSRRRSGEGNLPPFLGGGGVFRSPDGGQTWLNITRDLPLADAVISGLAASPTDSRTAWVTFYGAAPNAKVFMTNDAGATWINLSEGLPNEPVNVVVARASGDGGVFVGTESGVFYRDNITKAWRSYSSGMPKTIVTTLALNEATHTLFAGTFGRGVWLTDLPAAP